MKFTMLSDLHLDHWIGDNPVPNLKRLKSIFTKYLDPSPDVKLLLVSGDLSHNLYHFRALEELAIMYNYEKVFMVLGNHDMYLTTPLQHKLYKTSQAKQGAWYAQQSDIITIFNGTSETFEGVKFGGAMAWYDGTCNCPQGYTRETVDREWRRQMNDSYYIKGYTSLYEILDQELPKVEAVLDCDVIMTHVCPLNTKRAIHPNFRNEQSSMFYAFDGASYLAKTNAQYWVYGHSHGFHEFEAFDTKCIMNAFGYPTEKSMRHKLVNIEITV